MFLWHFPIQNIVVQSVELQGNRGGSGKRPLNSRGHWIAFFAGAAPLMTVNVVNWSVIRGAAPAKKAIQGPRLFRGLLPEPGVFFYGGVVLVAPSWFIGGIKGLCSTLVLTSHFLWHISWKTWFGRVTYILSLLLFKQSWPFFNRLYSFYQM